MSPHSKRTGNTRLPIRRLEITVRFPLPPTWLAPLGAQLPEPFHARQSLGLHHFPGRYLRRFRRLLVPIIAAQVLDLWTRLYQERQVMSNGNEDFIAT